MKKQVYISASELSDFVFCRLSWALKYQQGCGPDPIARAEQAAGEAWHIRQGRRFARPGTIEKVGALILVLGIIVVIVFWLVRGWSR